MKIGTSYSRCVRDIFDKKVSIDDVMVIVARTDFDPTVDKEWNSIWTGYTNSTGFSYPEWSNYDEHEEEFRKITLALWHLGKLHQPRKYGNFVSRTKDVWYDLVQTEDRLDQNPAAKKALENYKLIAGLV
jgi:hypothetical protein